MDELLRYALLNVAVGLLAFELILILICLIAIVCFKTAYGARRRKDQYVMQSLSDFVIKTLGNEAKDSHSTTESASQQNNVRIPPKPSIEIPRDLQDFNHLIETLENFDQRIVDPPWLELKKEIVDRYLQERAHKNAVSRSWMKRHYATRCFILEPKKENEPYLAKLIHDPNFLVRVVAAIAITRTNNRELFMDVIKQMARETPLSRFSYRDAILKGDTQKFTWIEELLKQEKDPTVQAVCLDLLSTRTTQNYFPLVLPFIYGSNNECRLLAIRILKQVPGNDSHEVLLHLLDDKDWKIREETLKDLDVSLIRKGATKIEGLLDDPNWNVRLQAALAIKKLGSQGLKVLSRQNANNEPAAYEISQYVIALPD